MKNLAEIICSELETPETRNLQERCLEAMVLMERFHGRSDALKLVPAAADADIRAEVVAGLANSLARFIRRFPQRPDVGSAIWALGKLRDPRLTELFERVISPGSGYDQFACHQAVVSLQDLGHEFRDA